MNQEYKNWKYQVEDERKNYTDKLQKLEKDAEVRKSKMQYDQAMKLKEEKAKFREEAQQGNMITKEGSKDIYCE